MLIRFLDQFLTSKQLMKHIESGRVVIWRIRNKWIENGKISKIFTRVLRNRRLSQNQDYHLYHSSSSKIHRFFWVPDMKTKPLVWIIFKCWGLLNLSNRYLVTLHFNKIPYVIMAQTLTKPETILQYRNLFIVFHWNKISFWLWDDYSRYSLDHNEIQKSARHVLPGLIQRYSLHDIFIEQKVKKVI